MTRIKVIADILESNARIAEQNAVIFDEAGLYVINLMGSPGAGKTSLLEWTVKDLSEHLRIGVIEGDIQSSIDAERISSLGIRTVQINTGGACHLDGNMIRPALDDFNLRELDLLIVENVGNLVCPAEFELGEDAKVMLLSVTEGDDKPQKYPLMFQQSAVLLVNKVDLLPYVNCSVDAIEERSLALNATIEVFPISCKTREGLKAWFAWLKKHVSEKRGSGCET
jgi:hydrogenase nickel incorporation protein HypB